MSTLPIVELVEVCERMATVNRTLFEQVGGWVADEPDPALQRWFAVGCHRHAWHAELWSQRRPVVPLDASPQMGRVGEPERRADWYAEQLAELQSDLAEIEARVDPLLDPSTLRVLTLVAADLAALATPSMSRSLPDPGVGAT